MSLAKYLAQQLLQPSGWVGRLVLPRLFNRRNAALNHVTLQALALEPADRVLEVGFGGGYLLGQMAQVVSQGFLAGVDISPEMVAFCTRRFRPQVKAGRMEFHCSGAEALPFPDGHFSKLCTVNTIFYFPDLERALAEFWRVLQVGGKAAICFTRRGSLEKKEFSQHGLTLYDGEDVRRLMEAAGLGGVQLLPGADRHREFVCAVGCKQPPQPIS